MSDLDELALALPQVTKEVSDDGRPSYLVHGKRFVLQRSRRPDAVDPETGERLDDVLMFRVADLDAMLAQLGAAGVEVLDDVQEAEGLGRFGWAIDPEGNRFELWEPPPGG